jgi:pimeloyl-ACP methyl ester carboxylesterase
VHGEEDLPIPMERALPMLDVLPDATLARISKAGHTTNLENASAVNEAIGQFLKRVEPA